MEPNNTDYNVSEENSFKKMPKHKNGNKAAMIAIILFVIVIAGMFVFAFLKQNNTNQPTENNQEQTDNDPYAGIERIDAKHFYIDGVHTLVGEIAMPTPCDLLNSKVLIAESYPEQITIDFTVINEADNCAQVVTPQRFKVSAEASPEASFKALFMGRPVPLNIIEAEPGETPDDFELYIKG